MTLDNLYTMLSGISGFSGKVAYHAFPVGEAPAMPFICYLETGGDSFAADGKTYFCGRKIAIELYCEKRETATEALIEAALTSSGIYFDRTVVYLNDEKCFETIYYCEV